MDECTRRRRLLAEEFLNYRKVFIALGDETRQQIFVALLENETIGMRVPEITRRTHLSRPAVSHHLGILKDAGLIAMHRVGTMNFYYVEAEGGCWRGLKALVDQVDAVVSSARASGYPHLAEDEVPDILQEGASCEVGGKREGAGQMDVTSGTKTRRQIK